MKLRTTSFFAAFLLFTASLPGIAQTAPEQVVAPADAAQISGRVINARDNEPMALVQVELSGTMFRAISDDDGMFQITGVPPGDYVLQSTTVNFYPVRTPITLAASEVRNIDVVMASSSAKLSSSVQVSADVFDAEQEPAAAGFTLEGEERKNLASVLADDPLRAVQNLPGVTSNNDFSSEFSVRGAPFSRVGLYLDGVLLHSPFHTTDGQADNGSITIFNGDLTDDMTLYQGAWPVRFADRTAGVLDVQTRQGTRDGIHGQASVSASNAGFTLEGPISKTKRGAWLVDYRKSYLQYILNRIDFGDQPPLAFGFDDAQARVDYNLTTHHAIDLTALHGSSSVDRTEFQSELSPNTVMTSGYRFSLVNFGSRYTPNARLLISNHLAWSHENGHVENRDNAPLNTGTYDEWTWRGDATVIWNKKSTLDFGGQYRDLHQDGTSTQFIYAPEITPSVDTSTGNGHQGGAYIQESFGLPSGRARFAAGVRQDEHSAASSSITSPYASVSFMPWKRTHLQFDWGEYGQYPELNQFFSKFAVTPVRQERATHYEATVEQRLDERTRLHVEFYDREDHGLLARPSLDPRLDADGTVINAQPDAPLLNSLHGYARGVEIYVQRRSVNGFTGWVSYAYGRAIITDDVLKQTFPSDYDQRHTFNAYASRRLRPTINVSGRFTYGSGMPFPAFYAVDANGYTLSEIRNGLRAPSYQRADLRLNKAFIRPRVKTTLFGEIVNLTNHKNSDFDSPGPYDPATGRTAPNFYSMFPILPSVGMLLEF
jgi:hypothetical protein